MSDVDVVWAQLRDCYDLHSVYVAYIEQFIEDGTAWYGRPWGRYFESFEAFLSFKWYACTVTDVDTGRSHVVTPLVDWFTFSRAIAERFGEKLPMLRITPMSVSPFETTSQRMHAVIDVATYRVLSSTLPALQLETQLVRAKKGEPSVVQKLWAGRDKTFLAIDFEWSERNPSQVLEWGYAVVRCGLGGPSHAFKGQWPPRPGTQYRRGHLIVQEHLNTTRNRHQPNFPLEYAFGNSQVVLKAQLPRVIQAVISSLASPDSESTPNKLVLIGHGVSGDLLRLREMGITIPHNVLIMDTAAFERQLFASGQRHPYVMETASGRPRQRGSTLSLCNTLKSLDVAVGCKLHNAGNDAMLCLLAFQLLLEPETEIPSPCKRQKAKSSPTNSPQTSSAPIYGVYLVNR